ncbi:FISUMP domain-containing protein [Chryseobacterium sp. NRRL B-14798]|uniref:FISUMP domain-containing protein n=1 Tax=Chryseobacterium sp. NRRL B-14798 TaxID=3162880 RepID=UPI003D23B8EC
MKKQTLLWMAGFIFPVTLYGQVGINTTSPLATLDVVAKHSDGSTPEGILVPRLTGDALFAASGTSQYGAGQEGAIVYITEAVSSGNDTGQTANVNAPGHYYFDSGENVWKKLGESSTIYTSNGTLTSPRVMDMNEGTMGFVNGRMSVGANTSNPSSILELQSITKGFLPPRMTRAQMYSIPDPSLGLVVYCTDCYANDQGCLMINDSTDGSTPKWGSMCSSNVSAPVIMSLDCSSAATSGSVYSGAPASGVSTAIPYTGGNGGAYQSVNFVSTGVTGLVASLPGGVLTTANGVLQFHISGTPSGSGTAVFAVSVAGQSCSFSIPVTASTATVSSLSCGSAVFSPSQITQWTSYTGTLTIPYTGGNGGAYPEYSFTQDGLTFTRPAGTLANGSGTIVYNVSGEPTTYGTKNISISFGGSNCTVTKSVAMSKTVLMPGNPKAWYRYNLGATDESLDPDIPVKEIHGNYYQWGRKAVVATASSTSGAISGWNPAYAGNNAWSDSSKTVNDPCPTGFRVPTRTQFQNLINNTTASNIGTWSTTTDATNFGAAKKFTGNGKTLTFPAAGFRSHTGGNLGSRGSTGRYWSSTQNTSDSAYSLNFYSSSVSVASSVRAGGYSVRCITE